MGDVWANVSVAASVLLTGLSVLLFVLAAVAWRRLRGARLAWVAVAFALFAVQGAFLAERSYTLRAEIAEAGLGAFAPTVTLIALATVAALYFAALQR